MALTDSSVSSTAPMMLLADTTRPGVVFWVTDPEGDMTRARVEPPTIPLSMIMPPPPLDTLGLLTPPRPRGVPRRGGPILMGMVFFLPICGRLSRILTSICLSGIFLLIIMFRLVESASRMGRSTCSCSEARAAAVSASRPVYFEFRKKKEIAGHVHVT